jgi:curved DNA-binding protein CbpA
MMKRIEDQTYYEILEITPKANAKEIQRAYDRARETFQADSLAVYSLFSEREVRVIRGRVEEAYRVLMDDGLREGYDRSHLSPGDLTPPEEFAELPEKATGGLELKASLPASLEPPSGREPLVYRGQTLKRIREKFGMDLRTVSSQTKITPRILEWLEEEAFEKLPPEVYLKGFLRAYAQCLGLVPQEVIDEYLRLAKENRGK